jgi:hypothetical protein
MIDRFASTLNDAWDFLWARGTPGMEAVRSHSWPWAPSLTILLLLAITVFVLNIYYREGGAAGRLTKTILATIRILIVALVIFMMYGWMLHRHRTDLPDLVVVLDDSASMATQDPFDDPEQLAALSERLERVRLDGPSRLNLARLLLLEEDGDLLTQLQRRYRLKAFRVGAAAQPVGGQADGEMPSGETADGEGASIGRAVRQIEAEDPVSRLGQGLRDILEMQRGRPTAAILMLTDGVTTEGKSIAEVASYARRKSVPLYLVGLGNSQPPRDVRVGDLLVDEVVFVDDLVNFDFTVTASGYEGKRVVVRLRHKDQDGTPLAQQALVLGADGLSKSVRLSHRPEETGDLEYLVEIDTLEGESNTENNQISRVVKVRDETLRVLYVQAYPNYEFRYLKSMLGRSLKRSGQEKSIDLTTVLQEADLEYAAVDETAQRVFPVSREELFRYDVLLFGDVNPSFLSRSVMENMVAFVEERGGGIVFLSGPKYTPLAYRDTPLATLMPIDLETVSAPPLGAVLSTGFTPQPSGPGVTSPQMQLSDTLAESLAVWRNLPELYWSVETPDLRPGARVLATDPARVTPGGEHMPIICTQFVGAGKVVFHATDETYRWARHPQGERYFARYWVQTLRYLSRSKLLQGNRVAELTCDRREYRRGEPVRLRVRFVDDRLAPVRDDGVTVVLEREGSKRRQLTLSRDDISRGVFEALAGDLPEGRYRVWLAVPTLEGQPPSQRFTVLAPPGEQARLEMDLADLQAAAETSQGKFYTFRTADDLTDDLPRGRHVRIESLPPVPVWNSPLLAGLTVLLLLGEWILRKRVGLL